MNPVPTDPRLDDLTRRRDANIIGEPEDLLPFAEADGECDSGWCFT